MVMIRSVTWSMMLVIKTVEKVFAYAITSKNFEMLNIIVSRDSVG